MKCRSFLLPMLIAGCSTSPLIEEFDPSSPNFELANNLELCEYLGLNLPLRKEAIQELRERGALSDADWTALEEKQVKVGNSKCVVKAIWGNSYKVKHIDSLNKYGDVQSKAIYSCRTEGIPYCPYTEIKFVNGKIVELDQKS